MKFDREERLILAALLLVGAVTGSLAKPRYKDGGYPKRSEGSLANPRYKDGGYPKRSEGLYSNLEAEEEYETRLLERVGDILEDLSGVVSSIANRRADNSAKVYSDAYKPADEHLLASSEELESLDNLKAKVEDDKSFDHEDDVFKKFLAKYFSHDRK
ncbi:uncharacterized protein [Watersipora subatra]|uniref:uncharacterized protein n=1 Tax=Watersipora subatra TaxID=2589382 RepID=UPI00355C02F5